MVEMARAKMIKRMIFIENRFLICELRGWRGESRTGVHRIEEILFGRKNYDETTLRCLKNLKSGEFIGKPIRLWCSFFVFERLVRWG